MVGFDLSHVLDEARSWGFLGPGPVATQLEHADALIDLLGPAVPRFLDLGSGGGLPGLALAQRWVEASGTLLDANERRCDFLSSAVARLGLADRVTIAHGRAEVLARQDDLRSTFDLIVARSFGPPATTAECAIGFLATGGRIVVSEPPDAEASTDRWQVEGLAKLGLRPATPHSQSGAHAVVLELEGPVSNRWPRRDGVPAKRPLWTVPLS